MNNWNTSESYGRVARWLHWGTALLFLLAYCAVYYRHWFTEKGTPENLVALYLHLSAGISVGVIVVLRITWRIMNQQPVMELGPHWQHVMAHVAHYALYAIMILMPLTGYLGTGKATDFFSCSRYRNLKRPGYLMYLSGNTLGLALISLKNLSISSIRISWGHG